MSDENGSVVDKRLLAHDLQSAEPHELKRIKLENDQQTLPPPPSSSSSSTTTSSTSTTTTPDASQSNELTTKDSKNTKIVVVPPTTPQLFYVPLKTGLVYDVRMRYHAKIFTSYYEYIDPHPEDPRRIYRIYKLLAEAGLITDSSLSGSDDLGPLMEKIPIREATAEEILNVHSEEHLRYILSTETMERDQLVLETEKGDSIYVNNDSFTAAKLSCGGTIEACKAVVEGRVKNSLAIVRPPGHHAEPDTPGGFCLFSNVAVAAKKMLQAYPELVRKIVIVDWDVHHGNGTQKSFYSDPRVLYISLHRYENGKFYPGTKYGLAQEVGEGDGEGFSLNIPWKTGGVKDGDYMYAFNRVIMPVISEFLPDLVIVSLGFDAAEGDIIGGCHVSPAGYGQMTHMLKSIARGKMLVILEGGYSLDAISRSALAVAKVLLGEPPQDTVLGLPSVEAVEAVNEVMKIHSQYWKSLRFGIPHNLLVDLFESENEDYKPLTCIADALRPSQISSLYTSDAFARLPILVGTDENSTFSVDPPPNMENIAIASPNFADCKDLVIVIHDPPEIWANINPVTGTIDSGSSVALTHPLKQIMQRVTKERAADSPDTAYIDICIPASGLPIPGLKTASSNYQPQIFAQEVLLYIWDNYLTYMPQLKKLVFVGFGEAYQAIVHLLSKRPAIEVKELVKGVAAFVGRHGLKPIVPMMDESMVDWYYQNSVIFTSLLNSCWSGSGAGTRNGGADDADAQKRPRRKYGRVLKASADGLSEVISERFDEAMDFILDSLDDFSSSSEH